MADLVLGLAKSAVEGTLSLAKSAIEEEKKFKKGVQRDLMLISDEFEMMHSFLNVTKERVTDDMTRTLVRQVRNMALDVEDCIETVTHLDDKSKWWLRLLPSCILTVKPTMALDDAVAAIELLKSRVEAMGQRNMRYRHIGDSSSKPAEKTHRQAVADAKPMDIIVEARDPRNMKRSPRDLIELISRSQQSLNPELINKNNGVLQLQVISVWGTGGDHGTTSIIKKAYNDPEICKNFICRAWVKLVHPFNPHDFIQSLLAQFCTNSCPQQGSNLNFMELTEVMVATEGVLIEEFMKQVSKQRYLVILEGVSTMVDWETVRVFLPDKYNGSCIIVHTQHLEIASLCVGQSHRVLELEQFSDDHSVCAFFNENRDEDEKAKIESAQEWLEKSQCVGHQVDIWELGAQVGLHSYDPKVVSVCGIAGVGKSYVVKHVYYKQMTLGRHFQKFGWVDVSHPFNLRDFSRSLLLDLHSGSLEHGSMLRIKDPIQECRELLRQNRCLIVIDSLQSKEEWDSIEAALAVRHTRSRVIVVAHEESLAAYCSKEIWWNITGLEVDEALAFFKMLVSEKTGSSSLSAVQIEQAKHILHMCGGLPKVIVAVAGFVGAKRDNWSLLRDSFMTVLENDRAFGSLQDLFAWVHYYFRSCPDFLKPCIFYLSIFPVNYSIRQRRLVRRWVAEGYSRDTKESTAEETAEQFLSKLCSLSMIQVPGVSMLTYYMRMRLCQVNGFFSEYVISRSIEENLVFALEGHCSMNSQRAGRHLTIGSTWDRDRIVYESIDFSRLRSLTVFGKWKSFFISDKMGLLRVLDLEGASSGVTDGDLELMVNLLPRLKFFSLRGCKDITRLPDSLGVLRQLQTLDIRHTSVVMLPLSITKLQKLQYIRAGTTVPLDDDSSMVESLPPPAAAATPSLSTPLISRPRTATLVSRLRLSEVRTRGCHRCPLPGSRNGGVKVPGGIGQMRALHTLGVVDVSVASGQAILEELKNLTQLRKLGVSGINRRNCQELCSAISGHAHLESLSVQLDEEKDQGCLDAISWPPENLQSLKLYGHVDHKLPTWIKLLLKLSKLNLQMTMLPSDEIDVLGSLPVLDNLCLCFREFKDGELRFSTGFDSLVVLEIVCNSRLQAVTFHSGVMDSLEWLKLRCCNVSSLRFSGLEELTDLKEVWLSGSYEETLKQQLKSQLAEHPKEIKPVLKEEPRSP